MVDLIHWASLMVFAVLSSWPTLVVSRDSRNLRTLQLTVKSSAGAVFASMPEVGAVTAAAWRMQLASAIMLPVAVWQYLRASAGASARSSHIGAASSPHACHVPERPAVESPPSGISAGVTAAAPNLRSSKHSG